MSYSELINSKVSGCVCEPYPVVPDQQIMATKRIGEAKHTLILQRGLSPQTVAKRVDEWMDHLDNLPKLG